MVDDHSKANDQLKQLAAQKGVSLPTIAGREGPGDQGSSLSKLQGAAFDKAYMKDMVADHKKDVAEFKHESMAAHDSGTEELGRADAADARKPSSGSREDRAASRCVHAGSDYGSSEATA